MAAHPSRFPGVLLALCLVPCGCGAPRVSPDGALIRVDVRGREITLPAPEGMADVLAQNYLVPPRMRSSDRMIALFVRSDLRPLVRQPGFHPPDAVMALIPVNTSSAAVNTAEFARLGARWADRARRLADSTTRMLSVEVDYCRTGVREAIDLPGDPPENGWCLGMTEPVPAVKQLLVVLPGEETGAMTFVDTCVLVRGRMIRLMWTRSTTNVQDIAEASTRAERWAKAVVEANPS